MAEENYEISLVSKEGTAFKVPRQVALMSNMVCESFADDDDDENPVEHHEVPLINVDTPVLEKIIQFCTHYTTVEPMTAIQTPLKSPRLEELVQEFYVNFVKVDRNLLFDMVAAANYMDIKPLLDLTCLAVSVLIRGKSAQELRTMFNMSEDFTEEEEAQIARENSWVEQPNGERAAEDGEANNNNNNSEAN